MERLGLGYDTVASVNPGVIYGSVTAFGRTGPYANAKGYEGLVMARIGALWASHNMVTREGPAHVSVPYCSYGASQQLLTGILAALHERTSSGLGQRVDTSLVKGVAALGTWNWYLQVITSKFPEAFTPSSPMGQSGLPLSPMIFMLLIGLSKDGRWLQFSQVQLHLYVEMLKVMDLDWMLKDEEWKGAVFAADDPKTGEFWDRLFTVVQSKTLEEWQAIFDKNHDVWAETMRRGSELLDHPQMQHLGAVVEIADASYGTVRQPGPIVKLSDTPAILERGAPVLDSDGDALRARPWTAKEVRESDGHTEGTALGDITMLELGTFFAAPFGGTVLRELGARVIKVEPLTGEPMRNLLPFPEVGGAKTMQGKESIAIDLSTDEGRQIVHALAKTADVVLQSFRAGVAERQGVDSATLRALNPNLVYLNAPGYGIDGPCGDRPAYAPTIGAGCGLVMRNIGASVPEHPDLSLQEIRANAIRLAGSGTTEYAQADGISALTVASAMALGVVARDRTGKAQTMLTTMLTSTAHALADDMVEYPGRPATATADPELFGFGPLYRLYRATDDWIFLAAPAEARVANVDACLEERGRPRRRPSLQRRSEAPRQRVRARRGTEVRLLHEARPTLGGFPPQQRRRMRRGPQRATRGHSPIEGIRSGLGPADRRRTSDLRRTRPTQALRRDVPQFDRSRTRVPGRPTHRSDTARARLFLRCDRGPARTDGGGLMSEIGSERVLVSERRGAVQILRLNRPEARNALSPELISQLGLGLVQAEEDPEVRAVVLTGTGARAFCAGMDLRSFAEGQSSSETHADGMRAFSRFTQGGITVPVVGAANATAVAGGLELLLGCDVVVASEAAVFGLPEVKRGLFAAGGGVYVSTRIPLAVALELTLTGDPIDATRAAALGLINLVVPAEQVLDSAVALAERIARNGPLAVRVTKEIVRTASTDLDKARGLAAEWQPKVFGSEDAKEGATAFIEKREPVWTGR